MPRRASGTRRPLTRATRTRCTSSASFTATVRVCRRTMPRREWYEKAADKGHADAMVNLGALYANGQGVAQDYIQAREWYEKAADKGSADAMTALASLYEHGDGVTQDYANAREWYEKAAHKGSALAVSSLERLSIRGAA